MDPIAQEYFFQIGLYLEENGHHSPSTALNIGYLKRIIPRPPHLSNLSLITLLKTTNPNNVRMYMHRDIILDGSPVRTITFYSPNPDEV